ncbi:MAG: SDR family NAD(P)-dependent oxidoreductase [Deltaproteobacteria bacterium]|nr:MAG: SDR family NAD(P)-dependent oxidoreductase [Deltaproteobacteria bacterium]
MGHDPLRILGLTPLESPDATLVSAFARAGAIGILDLGRQSARAQAAIDALGPRLRAVRVPEGVVAPELPESVEFVVLPEGVDLDPFASRKVLVQVTTARAAHAAEQAGAFGLIAKGSEAGGRVSDEGAFVLLQRLLAQSSLPVWVQGGVGVHSAAAAVAGGARGVVLDSQLSLLAECELSEEARLAIAAMDGSETRVVRGHRVYARPGLPTDALAEDLFANLGDGPMDQSLWPLGQDAALALSMSTHFPRVQSLVRGLQREIDGHIGQAVAASPLAPGSAFARAHGLRFPIAQGPMSRVSDVAGFAEAVSRGGGLPFLAVSMMRGQGLVDLLDETRERLGESDEPWGVGLLGFAPPDLRAEQLEAVRRAKPPVALLAGGRPSQARELEAEGIPTYLHVPSPGLLDLFLKDGARRFVFEGRECGGHVGPRTSFVLWDQFVERLLQHPTPHELHLLFAGGIHDGRSAAMVSALTAPLAAHGAKIGVLMGSAYLFTEEAVATGAITRTFQQAALACGDTVLVHSAPGHATRCAPSPFVEAFEAKRREMEAEGAAPEAIWEELERMNLGRLRIASKGIRREGAELVAVDADAQKSEGMFMIGQVAALRGETTTVEALHLEVSEGAAAWLSPPAPAESGRSADVAIIGMACFYPGAPDVHAFWSQLVLGRDLVTEVPPERWDVARYYDPDAAPGAKSASKWGGFLPPIDFDPLAYGIPPRSLAAVEPVQLLALEAAARALADAGYGETPFDRERTSVIFGAEAGTDLASAYGFRALFPQYLGDLPEELDAVLPTLTEDSFPGVLANVIAGRIANRLDLGGVNYTVDAACASSLAAVDLACKELLAGTSDMVLAGGADLHNAIGDYLMFSSVHALSKTGRSRPFDADADGISLGEGVAVVVCKRLADAERDGDRIYAVLKSVAGSSDGKSLGLTAPRKEGQMRALERAYARAGVSPTSVGLVEAHGTGTVVGDRTELGTLTEVFTRAGVRPGQVTLGSVKSNIGHTKCAAGLAGLLKVVLALHHRTLPPTLHVRRPNPGWNPDASPFVFRSQPSPWIAGEQDDRHAAVSAFGFGGTNFHCLVGAYDAPARTPEKGLKLWPAELFLLRDEAELDRLEAWVGRRPLRDLAASSCLRARDGAELAIVAESTEDLRDKLALAREGQDGRGIFRKQTLRGEVAFLFPGQGSQRPNMLADLFVAFPELQALIEPSYASVLFPPDTFDPQRRADARAAITDTRVAQPTLGLVERAAASLLDRMGLEPAVRAGHSYGELVALAHGGAIAWDDLPAISRIRGEAIHAAAGDAAGTMASAKASAEQVRPHLADGAVLANLNSPVQTVISGEEAAVAATEASLGEAGIAVKRFPVAAAFHSPLVAAAEKGFHEALGAFALRAPEGTVYANLTAAPYGEDTDVRDTLARHIVSPVRFVEQLDAMYATGVRLFVEVGPGRVLTRLAEQTFGDRPHAALSLEDPKGGGALDGLVRLLANLAMHGVRFDPSPLFEGRAEPVNLDRAPKPASPTLWQVNGHRAWPMRGKLPDFAMKPVTEPVLTSLAGGRDRVVLEYLETLKEQAEAQRRIMLAYLGETDHVGSGPSPAAGVLAPGAPAAGDSARLRSPHPAADEGRDQAEPPVVREPSEALLAIVSDRTGYPAEMLDLDLDLEADLSIDSIKRIEILGVLSDELGLGGGQVDRDKLVEELSSVKTLRGILGWLDQHQGGEGGEATPDADEAENDVPDRLLRFVPRTTELPPPAVGHLEQHRIGLLGRASLTEPLREALVGDGARVRLIRGQMEADSLDALVLFLREWKPAEDLPERLWEVASTLRQALAAGATRLLVVTDGGLFDAAGLSALLKTIRKESGVSVRRISLGHGDLTEHVAHVRDELLDPSGPEEVAWIEGKRLGLEMLPRERDLAERQLLDGRSVYLLTGGARGITARVAKRLAAERGGTFVLVGRSPEPPDEDPALAEVPDDALKKHLIAGGGSPAEIEKQAQRLLAAREMRRTFDAIRATGAKLVYVAADVRDRDAMQALVDRIVAEHGRIDAVVHGAGVLEDKLLRDKTEESFRRVVDTKVLGALALLDAVPEDTTVAFFGSVAGAFGNRGQVDYAAANDVLDRLAHARDGRTISLDWGPWGGGGMVSDALERQYARLGIGLIDPDEGTEALIGELVSGTERQVVLMRAELERMR